MAKIFQWDDSFHVQVKEIDTQHRQLVDIINRLAEAMAEGQGKSALRIIIAELTDYTIYHFRTEEELFRKFRYPDTDKHKQQHTVFIKKISEFKKDFDSGRLGISVEVLNFLCDWLKAHIKVIDKKAGSYINSQKSEQS